MPGSAQQMRILIIKTSALGDIIHALPVLAYLQEAAPGARIDWVVEEAFQDLLKGNPAVENLILVAFKRWKKSMLSIATFREILGFRRALRSEKYDLVFDLQGNTKSGLLCWLARGGHKIGFSRENLQERFSALFTNQKVPFRAVDSHAVTRYLRVISAPFELSPDNKQWQASIHTSAADDSYAAAVTGNSGVFPRLLFHTGTTWQTKLWHDEGWFGLGRQVLARYQDATIFFSWGNDEERVRAEGLVNRLGSRARLMERMSLKQFVAVMKRMQLVVGGDTGPIHLAAAVGTPTVSFYRCTDGSRNGPYGAEHSIVQSPLECTICMQKACDRDQACRESVSVAMMMDAVVARLSGRERGCNGT